MHGTPLLPPKGDHSDTEHYLGGNEAGDDEQLQRQAQLAAQRKAEAAQKGYQLQSPGEMPNNDNKSLGEVGKLSEAKLL